ncbi:DUF2975 domain-containing protein [Trichococcus ilyis]|uniref:DUF2975 domain-containing protein n=1 Tax=Trichococcus ilyis TaxID=640938 RepID=A0A143YBJ1_9LACT|nr:DUF2975 domain-containing protein [Trichococcus ilyis]CZQ84792.1 Hypothetical protein TR210_393 [Trichococcus ilyis]SEJ61526.1 Protein of unknown function [Trichococcus ilyis]
MQVKQGATTFLKGIILLFGMVMLALCFYWLPVIAIREPKAHPGDYSLYPLLIFVYGCCIAFSVALYQSFTLLNYIETDKAFSEFSLQSLQVIKKCGFTIIFCIVLAIATLRIIAEVSGDDAAGPISLSLMGILATSSLTAVVDVLQKLLKNIMDTKQK